MASIELDGRDWTASLTRGDVPTEVGANSFSNRGFRRKISHQSVGIYIIYCFIKVIVTNKPLACFLASRTLMFSAKSIRLTTQMHRIITPCILLVVYYHR